MPDKQIKIGYQYFDGNGLDRLGTLDVAIEEGADMLELSFLFADPAEVSEAEAAALRDRAREAGIALQLHAPLDPDCIGHPPFASTFALAEAIGADRVTVHLTSLLSLDEQPSWAQAARGGVVVGVENVYPRDASAVEVVRYLETLSVDAPVGMTFDVGHANLDGSETVPTAEAILPMLASLGREVANVHVHDNRGDADEHLLPGAGTVDQARVLPLLERAGATRFVIEHWQQRVMAMSRVRHWLGLDRRRAGACGPADRPCCQASAPGWRRQ